MDGVNLAILSLCGSNPRAVAFCCPPLSLPFVESGFDDCMGGSREIAVGCRRKGFTRRTGRCSCCCVDHVVRLAVRVRYSVRR